MLGARVPELPVGSTAWPAPSVPSLAPFSLRRARSASSVVPPSLPRLLEDMPRARDCAVVSDLSAKLLRGAVQASIAIPTIQRDVDEFLVLPVLVLEAPFPLSGLGSVSQALVPPLFSRLRFLRLILFKIFLLQALQLLPERVPQDANDVLLVLRGSKG